MNLSDLSTSVVYKQLVQYKVYYFAIPLCSLQLAYLEPPWLDIHLRIIR